DILIDKLRAGLAIENQEFTSILSLTMKDMLESRAKTFLDTLAQVYIEYTLQNQMLVNKKTEEYIDKQLDGVMLIMDSLEGVLENFKDVKEILDLEKEQNKAFKMLEETEKEERSLQLRMNALINIEDFLAKETDLSIIPPLNLLQDEDGALSKLVLDLFNLSQRKTELLVDMKPADRRVQKVDSVVKTIRNSIFRYTTDNKQQIKMRILDVQEQHRKAELELRDIPRSQRDLLSIERKLNVNEGQYTFLLQKKANTVIARAGIIPQTSVIEAARSLGVVGPEKSGTIWTFVGVGFFIALLIGFVRAIFFERIENTRELKAYTRMPLLGGIPNYQDVDLDPIVISSNPRSNVSEAFRSVRTNLQYILPDEGPKMILVTSLHPGEGKTFVSVNLASVLAKASKRVVILDFDMHKPKVHKSMRMENVSGISSYLIGKTDYRQSINASQVENLDVITAGPVPPNASELVLNQRVDQLFQEIKEQYDFVIIDTPPLLLISDSLVLLSKADLGIFVLNTEKATKAGLRHLEDILLMNNLKKNALMLNNIKQKRWKYYYGKYAYRYGYGYGYGNTYGGYMYGNNYYTEDVSTKTKRRKK
ncbi:MAG: polysaccharide biosynthesis tyrosine autokinase, partial [Flavobacteriales bacterium]